MNDFDFNYIKIADLEVAQLSKDKSRKIGCVLVKDGNVISTGRNGFPRGCDDNVPERHERPEKYHWTLHAELNSIINAAREGKSTLGANAYLNWFPCDQCAGVFVNAGIKKVFCDKEPDWNDPIWGELFRRAKTILEEGKIEIVYMNYKSHREVV